MMTMRRWISLCLVISITAILALSGCSNNNEGSNFKNGYAILYKKEVVTLTFWGGAPPDQGPAEVVENWNKANPDIQVEYERFVNDDAGNKTLETALLE